MRRSAAPSRSSGPKQSINSLTASNNIKSGSNKHKENITKGTARTTNSILNILSKSENPHILEFTSQGEPIDRNIEEDRGKIYKIVWGKKSTKKHKTWQGDGTLEISEQSATLKDDSGQILGRINNLKSNTIEEGSIITIGSKEVQIIELSTNGYSESPIITNDDNEKPIETKKRKSLSFTGMRSVGKLKRQKCALTDYEAFILPCPPPKHQWQQNDTNENVVEVSVDAVLASVLRPHQREGVTFLYKCALGFHDDKFCGSILADEMGLGKTLQCITLVWILLNQGPYGGKPIIHRVLIVTPSSLVTNWQTEFQKWLGRERIRTYVVDTKNKPKDYAQVANTPVIILSYEMFVRYFSDFKNISVDLMICDEGHRLKNGTVKAARLLNDLPCRRRILLTGTPIQNDLHEFYELVNFVNPGILGTPLEYRRHYEDTIKESREPGAVEDVKQIGEERAAELNTKTSTFILRRTQEINNKYLPTKQEIVLFCHISDLQRTLYEAAIDFWESRRCLSEISIKNDTAHLSLITALKKICNHPSLITQVNDNKSPREQSNLIEHLQNLLPAWDEMTVGDSGKLQIVATILTNTLLNNEKIILVSYFTQTLEMLEGLCTHNEYKYCRLDGSTPSSQRLDIVNKFNSNAETQVFLLSARAGGVGLNLTGASRLILYDSDWNPATDLQAMSRIWRDGQTNKNVYIYRLFTTGTIEEKIFQRQLFKTGLSGVVVDPQTSNSTCLSAAELKDLFTLNWSTDSLTHQALNCECPGNGSIPEMDANVSIDHHDERLCQLGISEQSTQSLRMNELQRWEHHSQGFLAKILHEIALEDVQGITFMFRNKFIK